MPANNSIFLVINNLHLVLIGIKGEIAVGAV
jgi:hypothetical protein